VIEPEKALKYVGISETERRKTKVPLKVDRLSCDFRDRKRRKTKEA